MAMLGCLPIITSSSMYVMKGGRRFPCCFTFVLLAKHLSQVRILFGVCLARLAFDGIVGGWRNR